MLSDDFGVTTAESSIRTTAHGISRHDFPGCIASVHRRAPNTLELSGDARSATSHAEASKTCRLHNFEKAPARNVR